jgi:hypothetical protein
MRFSKMLAAVAASAGFIAGSTMSASATIVCNDDVCWHVKETYTYPPEARVTVHEDTWKPSAKFTFREHEGRGYWRGETWTTW